MPRTVVLTIFASLMLPAPLATAQQPVAQLPGAPQQAIGPRAPFQLNAVEQAYLDQVLDKWEAESAKIQTFNCPFKRYVFNSFSPSPTIHFSEEQGHLSYQKPDMGSFRVDSIKQWQGASVAPGQTPPANQPPQGQHVELADAIGDHWVSDGQNIYEYRPQAKQLAVTPIPPEMQGEEIVNGPFPFLFGAKAEDLKKRYWMRVQPSNDQSVIVLVAFPKTRDDAGNYQRVDLILDRTSLLPRVIRITRPGGTRIGEADREVVEFDLAKVSINRVRDRVLWSRLFRSPRTPIGWKRVVNNPGVQAAAQPAGVAPR